MNPKPNNNNFKQFQQQFHQQFPVISTVEGVARNRAQGNWTQQFQRKELNATTTIKTQQEQGNWRTWKAARKLKCSNNNKEQIVEHGRLEGCSLNEGYDRTTRKLKPWRTGRNLVAAAWRTGRNLVADAWRTRRNLDEWRTWTVKWKGV